ncbi:MAG: hypothetical protein ABIN61_00460 [candidate division WOR-3 bacterium]
MSSCKTADPGWLYMLERPSLDRVECRYGYGYVYKDDSLGIKLTAQDFAFETDVILRIATPLDSIIIYPNFAYIESPHFVNKVHVPKMIGIKCVSNDSLIFKKMYEIDEIKGKIDLVSLEAWREDRINIKEYYGLKKAKKISKDEFLRPYCLQKGYLFSVYFSYKSFAIYDERNNQRIPFGSPNFTPEKSDFIFYYDIYNNNKPLTFYFKPTTGKVDEE